MIYSIDLDPDESMLQNTVTNDFLNPCKTSPANCLELPIGLQSRSLCASGLGSLQV